MSKLTSMMNIGKEMEKKLISVGIESNPARAYFAREVKKIMLTFSSFFRIRFAQS